VAAGEARDRRRWWRDVAVVGLLVTLVFSTIGVWFQVRQARETNEATQLGLLTTLNVTAKQAESGINATQAPDLRCKRDQIGQLTDEEEAAVNQALEFYDYLAWLFGRQHVTLKGAEEYLAPRMIDAYELGSAFFPPRALARDFPYLKRFHDEAPPEWQPPERCENPVTAASGP
jgi:hypothetical protein